ncbi:glycosyltransferase family 2 protein [Paracoccus pacificus]|uniref:Glycosyltransferase family 2 protein n=1 Tax=Paracoccus pacificus TaxID=1463598 RepID=A0ABW4R291_9RHOB
MTDLSLIITAHREGILAGPTIRSAQAAIAHARRAGVTVEVIVTLDRADDDTRAIMRHGFGRTEGAEVSFIETDEGDPGRARNVGIANASGFAATFLDADDLVSENWFTEAIRAVQSRPDAIFHPACNRVFGIENNLWWHVDSESTLFDPLYLEWSNYWTAISCAPVETYRRLPFAGNDLHRGFGHEDWHWNRVTLAAGHAHKPVLETVYFIRRRRGSQMSHVLAADGVSWPMRQPLVRAQPSNAKAR